MGAAQSIRAQTGPGGVGEAAGSGSQPQNVLWLRADQGVTTNVDTVTTWADQSGNRNDATLLTGDPVLSNNVFGGKPAVEFAASDRDVFNFNRGSPSSQLTDLATDDNTLVLVSRSTGEEENQFTLTFDNSTCQRPFGNNCPRSRITPDLRSIGYNVSLGVNGASGNLALAAVSGDEDDREVFSQTVATSEAHIVSSVFENGAVRQDLVANNAFEQSTDRANPIRDSAEEVVLGRLGQKTREFLGHDENDDNGFFSGEIAEVIAYDEALNAAQIRVLHNHLSEKYGISIENDFYAYDGNDVDVAGIGQADSSLGEAPKGAHTVANSAELRLSTNASTGFNDGEYVLFGHDDAAVSFSQVERPNGQATARKTDREWRVDLKDASSQSVNVSVAASDLPSLPSGFNDYAVFVDGDGDFSSGATFVDLEQSPSGARYEATGVDVDDGDYIAIAAIQRTISFAETGATDFENTSTSEPSLPLELNYPSQSGFSIAYSVSSGANIPANGTDYETCCEPNQSATFSFPAGQTTYDLQQAGSPAFRILDDGRSEDNTEFADITVVNPSSGPGAGLVAEGDATTFEFGIVDDDNSTKASLGSDDSEPEDSGSTFTVQVELSGTIGSDVTVDYELSGAATAGEDYENLEAGAVDSTSGTVTIPAGQSSTAFDLKILDDDTFEPDEEIVVTLVSAEGGITLQDDGGTLPEQVFTIVDDEAAPTISLRSQTITGTEGTQVQATAQLSAAAGIDVNVQFSVRDSTATGRDYTTLTTSPVTIPAGRTEASIGFALNRGDGREAQEAFRVDLTGTQSGNIPLASPQSADITILDADGIGREGPGGVGNSESLTTWLSADRLSLSDGSEVTTWPDRSGNDNDATVASGSGPAFQSGVSSFNGGSAVRFDGSDYLNVSGANDLGNGANTVFAVSATTTSSKQGIFAVTEVSPLGGGATDRRILRYASGPSGEEVEALNGGNAADGAVPGGGTPSVLGSVFDGAGVDVAVNRGASDTTTNVGTGPGTSAVIGAEIGFSGGQETRTNFLEGDIAELIVFNQALIEAQRIIVANALAAKYGRSLSNDDYYAGDTNAGFEENVIGIGAEGATLGDQHTQAERAGVRLNANSLSVGEYVFVGDTTQASANDININDVSGVSSVTARSDHRRYLDTKGQPTFDVTIDLDEFGLQGPAGQASNYRLLYRGSPSSGSWSTPATVGGRSTSGDKVTFTGVQFSSADEAVYITIGTTNQVASPLDTRLTTVRGTSGTNQSDEGWRFYGPPGSRDSGPVQMGEIRLRTPNGQVQTVDFRKPMSYTWSRTDGQWVAASADTDVPSGRGTIIFLYDDTFFPLDPELTIDPSENGTNGAFSYTGDTDVTVGDAAPTAADSALAGDVTSHLLANPYEVAYDLRGLQTLNQDGDNDGKNDWGTVAHVWNTFDESGNGDPRGTYELRSTDPAKPQPERMLSPGQAFFLERSDTTDDGGGLQSEITFSANGRETDEAIDFVGTTKAAALEKTRRAGQIKFQLQVRAEEDSIVSRDRALSLYFREGAEEGWDAFDASKLTPMSDSYATISVKGSDSDGRPVLKAQESRPYALEEPMEVPLALTTEGDVSGEATLSVAEWGSIPADWSVTLIDTKGTSDSRDDEQHTLNRDGTPYTFSIGKDTRSKSATDSGPHVPTSLRQRTKTEGASKSAAEDRFVLRVEPTSETLPVELSGLDAETEGQAAVLKWGTDSERNNIGFGVEHQPLTRNDTTTSPEDWREVGFVEGSGSTESAQDYQHRVSGLKSGRHVFRLRQVDADGTTTYSDEVEVTVQLEEGVKGPSPNPVQQRGTLLVTVHEAQPVEVVLYDVLGRRVRTIYDDEMAAEQTRRLQIDASGLSSGSYFIRVTGESFTETARMTVVK